MSILLSSQVSEEIEDLHLLIRATCGDESIVIHAPDPIIGQLDERVTADGQTVIKPARHFAYQSRVGPKVRGLVEFAALVRQERPRLLVTGPSMLKHRLVSRTSQIPHVAYFRGLHFNPNAQMGLSDKLRYGVFRGMDIPLFNSYGATHVLTVAQINREFALGRGIAEERISVIGPVWLEPQDGLVRAPDPPRVFFLTQAHATHGNETAQDRQLELIIDLVNRLKPTGRELTIRAHPRDFYGYENDPRLESVRVDRQKTREFLGQLTTSDIILSPLSTVAFEALYLGLTVAFFEADGVADRAVYDHLGIVPIRSEDLTKVVTGEIRGSVPSVDLFAPVDLARAAEVLKPESSLLSNPPIPG